MQGWLNIKNKSIDDIQHFNKIKGGNPSITIKAGKDLTKLSIHFCFVLSHFYILNNEQPAEKIKKTFSFAIALKRKKYLKLS
jgi:hypothetical protein